MAKQTGDGNKKFSTGDIYLTSFLSLRGFTPEAKVIGNKVIFEFELTNSLLRELGQFNTNPSIPLLDFITEIKKTRATLLSMRERG
jgi:hypothetical protein